MSINRKFIPRITIAAGMGALLVACGGGGSGNGGVNGRNISVESFGLLRQATSSEETSINLRRAIADTSSVISNSQEIELIETPAEPNGEALVVDGGGNFSTTNLQEAGVDEADMVKYDGDLLYVLEYSGIHAAAPERTQLADISQISSVVPAVIRLLRTDTETPATTEINRIEFETGNRNGGLYLYGEGQHKQLISVGDDKDFYHGGRFALDYHWRNYSTELNGWNVSDPTAPEALWSIRIDGGLLASRRIDNVLYVVTRYAAAVEGLVDWPATQAQREENQAIVDAVPIADLMPDISHDGGTTEELLDPADCYLPNPDYEDGPVPAGSGGLVTVTAIDLDAPARRNARQRLNIS